MAKLRESCQRLRCQRIAASPTGCPRSQENSIGREHIPLVPSRPQPVSKHWPLAAAQRLRRVRCRVWIEARLGILANTIRHVISDQGLDLAAGLAFYALLSMAPATLALVSMLGVVGEAKSTAEAVSLGLTSDLSTEGSPGDPADRHRAGVIAGRRSHSHRQCRSRDLVIVEIRRRLRTCSEQGLRC